MANPARWTSVGDCQGDCDEFAIVVMTESFIVKEMYRIPREAAAEKVSGNGRLRWDAITEYRVYPPMECIPQPLRALFG